MSAGMLSEHASNCALDDECGVAEEHRNGCTECVASEHSSNCRLFAKGQRIKQQDATVEHMQRQYVQLAYPLSSRQQGAHALAFTVPLISRKMDCLMPHPSFAAL